MPEQTKIIGYDDISITAFNSVPISTVHQQVDVLGEKLCEQLLAALDGKEDPGADGRACACIPDAESIHTGRGMRMCDQRKEGQCSPLFFQRGEGLLRGKRCEK